MKRRFHPEKMEVVRLGDTGLAVIRRVYPSRAIPGLEGYVCIWEQQYFVRKDEIGYRIDWKKQGAPFMAFRFGKIGVK